MSGFEWLSQFAGFIGSLFPRLAIVKETHCAVKFVRGSCVKPLTPGLHIYWPLVTEYLEMPRVRQTVNLATQVVLTHDEKSTAASGIIVYEVVDAVKALSKSFDVDETIGDVGLTAVAAVLASHPLNTLMEWQRTGQLTKELTRTCRSSLVPFGIRVLQCALTDFSTTQVITLLGQAAGMPIVPPPT